MIPLVNPLIKSVDSCALARSSRRLPSRFRSSLLPIAIFSLIPLSVTPATSADSALPPVTHQFLGNSYTPKVFEPIGRVIFQATLIESIQISQAGTATSIDLTPKADSPNTVIATGKNGLLVHVFGEANGRFLLSSYLHDGTKFTKAGIKTTYIEPGVLDNKNQYVYGRMVRDGIDSTRIGRQSVKTGALTYHFDTKSHGGGFVCGITSDNEFKEAYFTQLLPNETILYSFNLNNGSYRKVQTLGPGFCLDAVINSNKFAGTFINAKAKKWEPKKLAFVDLAKSKKVITLDLPFDLKWIGEHQMLVAENYLYLNDVYPDTNEPQQVLNMDPTHYYIDLSKDFGDPSAIIKVPAVDALFGRFESLNYLPLKLRS